MFRLARNRAGEKAPTELSAIGFGQVVVRFSGPRPVAADRGIGLAGEIVMPRVVGSGHEARVAIDDNRPGVFERRRAGWDGIRGIRGCAGGAGVGSVERIVDC